jgi:hypothetical protein
MSRPHLTRWPRRWMIPLSLTLLVGAGSLATMGLAMQTQGAPSKPTLHGGYFDDFLMLAADQEAGLLAGYYDDGKCRFAFRDQLKPIELYQRRDFGEAYQVQSWEPASPDRRFTTTIYSRSRGGYQGSITLEPDRNSPSRPAACRFRITLDRASNISLGFFGVRVIRKSRPTVFDIVPAGDTVKMVVKRQKPLRRGTGVWAVRTSSPAYSPDGFIYINWYDPPGTPQGGYVRERDFFPLPPLDES